MPQISRKQLRLLSRGVNLSFPPDQLPEGYFPKLINANLTQLGELEARPGSSKLNGLVMADTFIHSMRRMNNLIPSALLDHQLFSGAGANLYAGELLPAQIATGFSGTPMSMISYRPDQSPEPWMYIADQNKLVKVNIANTVYNVGILSPGTAPSSEIAQPLYSELTTSGAWTNTGTAGAVAIVVRVTAGTVVATLLYDSGVTGWACIVPTNGTGNFSWLQPGERLLLNAGAETVTVESVQNTISATTIQSIIYDSGTTGACSIVLVGATPQLQRNSLLALSTTETVRVLSVMTGPNGQLSFRCVTVLNHLAGDVATGYVSFRCYTTTPIVIANTITGNTTQFTTTVGTGIQTKTIALDLSQISGRPVQPDDYIHISINLDNPSALVEGRIEMDVDINTNDFTRNYYYKAFRQNDLNPAAAALLPTTQTVQTVISNTVYDAADPRSSSAQLGLGGIQYSELVFKVSDLVRVGADNSRSLANIATTRIQLTVTSTVITRLDSWWVGGTYGTDVSINSPTGLKYRYRYRSSVTGARSNPSPTVRYPLFPSRQAVNLTCITSGEAQVDQIDIERYDPSLQSGTEATWVYIASIPNAAPTYQDQSVAAVIASNPAFELDRFKPFPVLDIPKSGTCNIAGTSIKWVSGDLFPLTLAPGTVITLGAPGQSTAYQTFSFPVTTTFLELITSAGSGTAVSFHIASPVLVGQLLPVLFGPLEGPLASFLFSLGDIRNPGTVYWTNGNDPDSASDLNTIEITSPSEPLIGGIVWNTLVYVFSRERAFILRPSFDATGQFQFTFYSIPVESGLWVSWAICAGKDGVYYLGRDGVYKIAGETTSSVTDDTLYPLFPHEGGAASGTADYLPVNMQAYSYLRLSYVEGDIYFNYKDRSGLLNTMRLDSTVKGWFPHLYPIQATFQYWEETPQSANPRLLIGSDTGFLSAAGGTTDDGVLVAVNIRTPSFDSDDSRSQKLYIDLITDLIGTADLVLGFNNFSTTLAPVSVAEGPVRGQVISNISSQSALTLYRNIAGEYTFTVAGTRIFIFEPSHFTQPYLSRSVLLRSDSGLADWQVLRDGLFAIISTADVSLTVNIDGVQNSYTLPSTAGSLRKVYNIFKHASKGRMLVWQLTSPDPFAFFPDETTIKLKSWKSNVFAEIHVFASDSSIDVANRLLQQ